MLRRLSSAGTLNGRGTLCKRLKLHTREANIRAKERNTGGSATQLVEKPDGAAPAPPSKKPSLRRLAKEVSSTRLFIPASGLKPRSNAAAHLLVRRLHGERLTVREQGFLILEEPSSSGMAYVVSVTVRILTVLSTTAAAAKSIDWFTEHTGMLPWQIASFVFDVRPCAPKTSPRRTRPSGREPKSPPSAPRLARKRRARSPLPIASAALRSSALCTCAGSLYRRGLRTDRLLRAVAAACSPRPFHLARWPHRRAASARLRHVRLPRRPRGDAPVAARPRGLRTSALDQAVSLL
jgi:hypothetical protein